VYTIALFGFHDEWDNGCGTGPLTERGRTCFRPGTHGLNLPILARAAALPCGGAIECALDLSQIPRDLLELQICAVLRRQTGCATSAGPDDGGCAVAEKLAEAAGGRQRRATQRPRSGLGRCGFCKRHAHPARGAHRNCGPLPGAQVGDSRGRTDCQQRSGAGTQSGPRGNRRGGESDRRSCAGFGAGAGDGSSWRIDRGKLADSFVAIARHSANGGLDGIRDDGTGSQVRESPASGERNWSRNA